MLRILRVTPFYAPAYGYGGPVVHTVNISKQQAILGHDVRVFTSNILTHEIISKELPKFEIIDNVKIHRFPIKFRLGQSHYFITPSLPFAFFKYRYDLIHVHSLRTFQTNVATIISRLKNKPCVFTAHGTLRSMYLLDLFNNRKKESGKMKLFDTIFKKSFLKAIDRFIVHSKHEKKWTLKFNVPEEKIRVIPHGINLENFSNLTFRENFIKKYKINLNDKMILYVGRLLRNYRKLEHLILIMNEILKEINNAKLWLIGQSYDKVYELKLRNMVEKMNLTKHVIFITSPSREDILGAYQVANVITFPINNSDGFGIPLIEAGAAKCPIISTNRGPAPELVKNGETGILTQVDNLSELKNAFLKILSDEKLEKDMGLKGYQNVLKNYTWETITNITNKVYDEVIQQQ